MFDRPQIVTPDSHPEKHFVFVKRAENVSAFLRAADGLVLSGEHRIICWRPPNADSGQSIRGMLEEEEGGKDTIFYTSRIKTHISFQAETNMHLDNDPYRLRDNIILDNAPCNMTQTLEGPGTPFFFISPETPGRDALYKRLRQSSMMAQEINATGLQDRIAGPFSLAAGNVALILSAQFGRQATLHGFPVRESPQDRRQTLISEILPAGFR